MLPNGHCRSARVTQSFVFVFLSSSKLKENLTELHTQGQLVIFNKYLAARFGTVIHANTKNRRRFSGIATWSRSCNFHYNLPRFTLDVLLVSRHAFPSPIPRNYFILMQAPSSSCCGFAFKSCAFIYIRKTNRCNCLRWYSFPQFQDSNVIEEFFPTIIRMSYDFSHVWQYPCFDPYIVLSNTDL